MNLHLKYLENAARHNIMFMDAQGRNLMLNA